MPWNGAQAVIVRSQTGKNASGTSAPEKRLTTAVCAQINPTPLTVQKHSSANRKLIRNLMANPSAMLGRNSSAATDEAGGATPTASTATTRASTALSSPSISAPPSAIASCAAR